MSGTPMCIHCRVKPRRPFVDCCSDECEDARVREDRAEQEEDERGKAEAEK